MFVAFCSSMVPFGRMKSLLLLPSKLPIKPVVIPLNFSLIRVSQIRNRLPRLILIVFTKIYKGNKTNDY